MSNGSDWRPGGSVTATGTDLRVRVLPPSTADVVGVSASSEDPAGDHAHLINIGIHAHNMPTYSPQYEVTRYIFPALNWLTFTTARSQNFIRFLKYTSTESL